MCLYLHVNYCTTKDRAVLRSMDKKPIHTLEILESDLNW